MIHRSAFSEGNMDFISENLTTIESRYGAPATETWRYTMIEDEFALVRRSKKKNRAHDVTVYIIEGDQVAVVAKPSYPPGIYRAPSGGIDPGENLEEGATREAHEETGLVVELRSYVLRVHVSFSCGNEQIDWISHVFTASRIAGDIHPIDTREIAEARWVTFDELNGPIQQAMEASGRNGLLYRADLHRRVAVELTARGLCLNEDAILDGNSERPVGFGGAARTCETMPEATE